ncbi:hypothetical protein [Algisphaera agarilytica]|uniref:Tetratricopeptide repeat-containing protein n=1 Tax=Algisphaera agarilytica TaxID=1385975 RepID=A0A7X0H451_9BACT|nr:hypothetical protein [Algisphaera agarilytica]MBB6428937.1 hypothetical protein [Algisphaera agarilytica]
MAFFGKKKSSGDSAAPAADGAGDGMDSGSGGSVAGAAASGPSFPRDPRKARKFFDHAETVSEAKNYDYAVEMYINGLRHDPDNMSRHEELLEVAKRRKLAGGKKAGFKDKNLKSLGPDAVAKMLDAERVWAMNFLENALMREFMRRAVDANDAEPDLNLGEVAYWIGCMALDFANPKGKSKDYIQLRDLFSRIGSFDKAIIANKKAYQLDPKNDNLLAELKDLEAQNYANKNTSTEEGGFRDNLKDDEAALEAQQGNTRAVSVVDQNIEKRRDEYEEDPEDIDRLTKLVDALLKKEEYEEEEEAMKLLGKAHEQTGQYRHKVRIGDIKMKQYNRDLRDIKKNLEVAPGDDYFTGRLEETTQEKLQFELGEYQERVKNYPTDLKLKYELGRRMYQAELIDEAIGLLQDAKREPKSKGNAYLILGRCFMQKEWVDEAISTLAEAIEGHGVPDDALGKELRYDKMVALMKNAENAKNLDHAEEANQLASELLQADIKYKDIMDKKKAATELLNTLRNG